jgi:hypothetical protein
VEFIKTAFLFLLGRRDEIDVEYFGKSLFVMKLDIKGKGNSVRNRTMKEYRGSKDKFQ